MIWDHIFLLSGSHSHRGGVGSRGTQVHLEWCDTNHWGEQAPRGPWALGVLLRVSLGCPGQMPKQKAVVKVKLNKPLAVREWAFGGKTINWKYSWNRLSVAWDLTLKWGSEVKLQALTLMRSSCCYGNWELWDCGVQVSQQSIIYRHCNGDKEANVRSVDQSQCGVQSKELQATKIQPLCCWRNPDGTGSQSPWQWEPTFSEVRFISQLRSSCWPNGTFTQIGAKCLVCFRSWMSYWCIIQVLSIVLLLLFLVLFDNTITNLTQHNQTCLLFGFAAGVVCTRETWWQSRTHKPCLSAEIQLMSEVGKLNKQSLFNTSFINFPCCQNVYVAI